MHLPVDPHLDLVLLLARSLGAKLVANGRETDPKDTPLFPHEQEFVFLSTSRCTDLKRNAVRPEIVSMGQERVETQHMARRRAAAAHSHTTVKKRMKTALILATSFAPTSKKN
jgi:hypothetical protein